MNVNEKGHLGLVCVIRDLVTRGYEVFLPQHDYSAVDLIALDSKGAPRRLQVKYREARNDTVSVQLYSVVNGKRIPIDRTKIDGWAVYVPGWEQIAYVVLAGMKPNAKSFSLRLAPVRVVSNPTTAVSFVSELVDPKILW